MDYQNPRKTLTREQKTGFVLLLVFGILAVGLGVLQIRNNIFNPFVVQVSKQDMETTRLFTDENAKLQSIDTDQDGLNDFEELTFYETSPYLPDTDSDGISDKQEIENGTNPTCPEGEECNASEILPTTTSSLQLLNVSSTMPSDLFSGNATNLEDLGKGIQILSTNPSKIREMVLLSGAITKEQLAKIDDETLLKLFKDAIVEQGGAQYLNSDVMENNTTGTESNTLINTSTKKSSR